MNFLSRVNEEGYLTGPPELIAEVASSSAAIDLRDKRRAYCRNRLREYLVGLVTEGRLEWICLEGDEYQALVPDVQGMLHSRIFPWPRAAGRRHRPGPGCRVAAATAGGKDDCHK